MRPASKKKVDNFHRNAQGNHLGFFQNEADFSAREAYLPTFRAETILVENLSTCGSGDSSGIANAKPKYPPDAIKLIFIC